MAKFHSKIINHRKEYFEEELDEEKLGPRSYEWTRNLLPDEDKSNPNPTRFELFGARKRFEADFTETRKIQKLKLKNERLGKMKSALEACMHKFSVLKNGDNSELKMIKSRRMTRSVSSKLEKLNVEMEEIRNEIAKKSNNLNDEIVSNFIWDLDCINDRIKAYGTGTYRPPDIKKASQSIREGMKIGFELLRNMDENTTREEVKSSVIKMLICMKKSLLWLNEYPGDLEWDLLDQERAR